MNKGGLDRNWENLHEEKLEGLHDIISSWVEELVSQGKITKLRDTGMSELDGKWFSNFMAEIHGTLDVLLRQVERIWMMSETYTPKE